MNTRWTIKVSQETGRTLRTFLAQRGMKKGALAHFVEEAAQERLLRLAIAEAREENADLSAEEIAALAPS
jgi:predicted ATP-dependent protease